ncbi:MAG: PHP domain-containing protein [Clostridia bacterium]|nr:PHP domain-containing protein [Clostridia bacterium]
MITLIDKSKGFYKANLHCHTTNSDGRLSPEKIKEEYMRRGYSAVAFSDHEHLIDNSHLTDENFVAITACEIAIKELPEGSTLTHPLMRATHLCLYAKDPHNTLTPCYSSKYDHFINYHVEGKIRYDGEYERVYSKEGISDITRRAHEAGFLVCYNHPGWSLESAEQYLGYEGIDFVEILNTGSLIKGLQDDEAAFAELLLAGKRVFCTASDDNHNRHPLDSPYSDSFGSFVMINSDTLSYRGIISALERGDFYASQGPELYSITLDGAIVNVECSPCRAISLVTRGRRSESKRAAKGETLSCATFKLRENEDGFRIKIEDGEGSRAYSQFYCLKDLSE